tara:strand:+ start:546 stop:1199 length:654 start_codon:yes stop_codon:yes gene_type:complete
LQTAILIPAYNTGSKISSLIDKISTNYKCLIIIVDDGSSEPIKIDSDDVVVIRNKVNRGKGYSLVKGMQYAYKHGIDSVVTIDSDGQHDPVYINDFINYPSNVDIVIGSRTFNQKMPIHRRISNIITSYIISLFIGSRVIDSQSGYRRYLLKKIITIDTVEKGFQFESEILIRAGRDGLTFGNINISTIYNNEISNINKVFDTIRFIKMIFVLIIWK